MSTKNQPYALNGDVEVNQHFAPNLLTWLLVRGISELSGKKLFAPQWQAHSRLSAQ
ncbi:MAG: hypothetical protein QM639_02640 [Rhodocyclaceae bacterium]|jgi:hypothetical protein